MGGDDGLNAVASAELGEDVADVGLHRLHPEEQLARDFGVGQATDEQPQDLRSRSVSGRTQAAPHRTAGRPPPGARGDDPRCLTARAVRRVSG